MNPEFNDPLNSAIEVGLKKLYGNYPSLRVIPQKDFMNSYVDFSILHEEYSKLKGDENSKKKYLSNLSRELALGTKGLTSQGESVLNGSAIFKVPRKFKGLLPERFKNKTVDYSPGEEIRNLYELYEGANYSRSSIGDVNAEFMGYTFEVAAGAINHALNTGTITPETADKMFKRLDEIIGKKKEQVYGEVKNRLENLLDNANNFKIAAAVLFLASAIVFFVSSSFFVGFVVSENSNSANFGGIIAFLLLILAIVMFLISFFKKRRKEEILVHKKRSNVILGKKVNPQNKKFKKIVKKRK